MILKLGRKEIEKILSQKTHFEHVENVTGVPWQAVAAVWYRESLSVASPKTPGGPFQFDPPLSQQAMRYLLVKFAKALTPPEVEALVKKGVNDFYAASYFAACFLRLKIKPRITPDASDEVIKEAFWAYNGRAYGSADRSPYVMNGFDAEHSDMVIKGSIPDKDNPRKRIYIETVDKRPGAFTVYKQLKELEGVQDEKRDREPVVLPVVLPAGASGGGEETATQ